MLTGLSFTDIIIVLGSLLVSLGVHEAMHAFTAHRLGDPTAANEGRLTLNPLKHIDLFTTILLPAVLMLMRLPPIFIARPVPFDPGMVRHGEYGAALVALAGPFSNLGLALLGSLLAKSGLFGVEIVHILILFILVNIGLFVFNMLPIPPLDGSRLLYAFAPEPIQRIMMQIESFGMIAIVLIILVLSQFLGPVLSNINEVIFNFLLR
jgi:Zn-dependent protease